MNNMTPHALLREFFGYDSFRPGQEPVIDALLAGRSALAVFPTGGGKSLTYQLPALALDGVTLVVSPLIALMKDQIDYLRSRGIAAARLDSSLSLDQTRLIGDQLQDGTLKLLYVAPERFNNERFLAQIARTKISLFAIDEAHCISAWGHNFRPDYLKLADASRALGAERVLALTATATPQVVEDIRAAFAIAPDDAIVTGFYRSNLRLATTPVAADRRDALLRDRIAKRPPGPTIVYVTLQKTAERIASLLCQSGFLSAAYHAGMESDERARVQDEWMRSDRGVVVATIAFGMGIDKSDVRYVYHYNLPKSLEAYSQEVGRAGRDGEWSTVEMLCCPDDVPMLENFAYGDTPTAPALRGLVDELLSAGPEFDVGLYGMAQRHDLRQLVLRTALTYLEIEGVLKQGTPFYAGYEFRARTGWNPTTMAAAFPAAAGELTRSLFQTAKKAISWNSINPDEASVALGIERRRIVRALEVLEERGMIEMRVSDTRQRYSRLRDNDDAGALANMLFERFSAREEAEVSRVGQVLDLVVHEGCQVNLLVGYFGEHRETPCGHCTFCKTGKRQVLPPLPALPPLPDSLIREVALLRREYPAALGEARQCARFLCGLTSPALTRAKLSRHRLFGALEERRFADVMAWVGG